MYALTILVFVTCIMAVLAVHLFQDQDLWNFGLSIPFTHPRPFALDGDLAIDWACSHFFSRSRAHPGWPHAVL